MAKIERFYHLQVATFVDLFPDAWSDLGDQPQVWTHNLGEVRVQGRTTACAADREGTPQHVYDPEVGWVPVHFGDLVGFPRARCWLPRRVLVRAF